MRFERVYKGLGGRMRFVLRVGKKKKKGVQPPKRKKIVILISLTLPLVEWLGILYKELIMMKVFSGTDPY